MCRQSWQSGRFKHQGTRVQIKPSVIFTYNFINFKVLRKDRREKDASNGPFVKCDFEIEAYPIPGGGDVKNLHFLNEF